MKTDPHLSSESHSEVPMQKSHTPSGTSNTLGTQGQASEQSFLCLIAEIFIPGALVRCEAHLWKRL